MLTYEDMKNAGVLFEGDYARIPENMRDSMIAYVEEYREPGGFLSAVIRNDLLNAVCRADNRNLSLIKEYTQWFYNVAPMGCFGSPEKMKAWLLRKSERMDSQEA